MIKTLLQGALFGLAVGIGLALVGLVIFAPLIWIMSTMIIHGDGLQMTLGTLLMLIWLFACAGGIAAFMMELDNRRTNGGPR